MKISIYLSIYKFCLFIRPVTVALYKKGQGRLKACSTCSKHTGAEGAATVNKALSAIGNGAKRQMNTVKFWLEPALKRGYQNPGNGVV